MGRKGTKKQRLRRAQERVAQPPLRIPVGAFVDRAEKKLFVFTDDILLNQLRRDGPRIEQSFDALCSADLQELSTQFSRTSALIFSGLAVALRSDDKLRFAIAQLLMNGCNSFTAAAATLRMGFVLQPGIIIRSLLETISTALHLLLNPRDLPAYEAHELQSPKTIAAAKRAIPLFGTLYGNFSNNFAHIGALHKSITPISPYTERHEALSINLSILRLAAWLLYVTVELVFLELVESPRYWCKVENGYAFEPDANEREWMKEFLGAKNAI